jgi:hypothetical protein
MSNFVSELEKDENGNVILQPLIEWITGTPAGTG